MKIKMTYQELLSCLLEGYISPLNHARKKKTVNVLSLFDGMSCCRIALERAGYMVGKYYASEIDKYAIKVTQHNNPSTMQLGSATDWQEWDIDWSSIDLVTGGFPCQAWSVAGKQMGDKDERGALFWTMLDVMKKARSCNPDVKFLIENVKMKREFEEYITHHTEEALGGVRKILINSALVSAQNRNRYYWTSFETNQPEDKGITLSDVIEGGEVDRDKSHCLDANCFKGGNLKSYFESHRRQLVFSVDNESGIYRLSDNTRVKGVTENEDGFRPHKGDKSKSGLSECNRILKLTASKTPTLTISHAPKLALNLDVNDLFYRKLTPTECERLQTVPEGYTSCVSDTQRYKMLGNGWTVDVIAHLLRNSGL